MFTIETLNSISPKGLERLPTSLFQIVDEPNGQPAEGILVRSADMLNAELPAELLAIARAGAGTNNIPTDRCSEAGIVVFNTPGANANAVKELVLGGLVLSSRNVVGGIEWAQGIAGDGDVAKAVEKGKSKFVGPELAGKTLGVIGLGAIGVRVANMATHLDMEVLGYDPYISVDSAWNLSRNVKRSVSLSEVVQNADYITLHMPSTSETKGMINQESLAQMKQGARILNFARADLVDDAALLTALKNGRIACYVTDFPTDAVAGKPGVIAIPHLGASTPESEENCAMMAADQLREYLLNGNIINSVNFPNVNVPKNGGSRICVINRNAKGILAGLTAVINGAGLNIENMTNKSRGDYAYTLVDVAGSAEPAAVDAIRALEGVIRVRVV